MDRRAVSDETGAPACLDLQKRFRFTGPIALGVAVLVESCGGATVESPSRDGSMVQSGSDSGPSADGAPGSSSESGPSQESDSSVDSTLDSAFDSTSGPNDADAHVVDGPIFAPPDVLCEGPACPSPTLTPSGGTIAAGSTVTITVLALPANATIYYTTDNTLPTHSSAIYQMPIRVDHSETIRAFAYAWCMCVDSAIGYGTYTVLGVDAGAD
jgi:hypothetical protein